MFNRYTAYAFHALEQTQALACAEEVPASPEHLAIALFSDDLSVAHHILRRFGTSPPEMAEACRARRHERVTRYGTEGDLKTTQTILTLVSNFGWRRIGTEHLLLGLLLHQRNIPAEILRQQGIRASRVRRIIQKYEEAASFTRTMTSLTERQLKQLARGVMYGRLPLKVQLMTEFLVREPCIPPEVVVTIERLGDPATFVLKVGEAAFEIRPRAS